jgi:hypothetical protein
MDMMSEQAFLYLMIGVCLLLAIYFIDFSPSPSQSRCVTYQKYQIGNITDWCSYYWNGFIRISIGDCKSGNTYSVTNAVTLNETIKECE